MCCSHPEELLHLLILWNSSQSLQVRSRHPACVWTTEGKKLIVKWLLPSAALSLICRVVPLDNLPKLKTFFFLSVGCLSTTAAEEGAVREPALDTWRCLVAVSFQHDMTVFYCANPCCHLLISPLYVVVIRRCCHIICFSPRSRRSKLLQHLSDAFSKSQRVQIWTLPIFV